MRSRRLTWRWIAVPLLLVLAVPGAACAQSLRDAAEAARTAWLGHDAAGLVQSDSVALRLAGMSAGSVPIPASQAIRMLGQYLAPAREVGFELRSVRAAGPDQGYAEARRRYVVRGTTDEMSETVFLGFRFSGGQWRLRDIRVSP
jgi:hypothetical protein